MEQSLDFILAAPIRAAMGVLPDGSGSGMKGRTDR